MIILIPLSFFLYCWSLSSVASQCINSNIIHDYTNNQCVLCSYEFYDANFNFNITSLTQPQNCTMKLNVTIFRSILIINQNITTVNGNLSIFDAVYDDLLNSLTSEQIFLSKFSNSQLIIFFSKGDHFFLRTDSKISYFKRINISVIFQPLACSYLWIKEICNFQSEKPRIFLKSFLFSVYISLYLEINNIIFDAIDTNFNISRSDDISCLFQKNICCNESSLTINSENPCYILNSKIENYNQNDGLFILEAIFDDPNFLIPQIKLINTTFSNFFLKNKSYIKIDYFGGNILLSNVSFSSFFFNNLILFNNSLSKNYFNFEELNDFLQIFKNRTFETKIEINDLVFTNYNIYFFQTLDSPALFHLNHYPGQFLMNSISILNSSFIQNIYLFYFIHCQNEILMENVKIENSNNLSLLYVEASNFSLFYFSIMNSTWSNYSMYFLDNQLVALHFLSLKESFPNLNSIVFFLVSVNTSSFTLQSSFFISLPRLQFFFINSITTILSCGFYNLISSPGFIFQSSSFFFIANSLINITGFAGLFKSISCMEGQMISMVAKNLSGTYILSGISLFRLTISNSNFQSLSSLNYFLDKTMVIQQINLINSSFINIKLNNAFIYTMTKTSLLLFFVTFSNISLITSKSTCIISIQMGQETLESVFFSNVLIFAGGTAIINFKTSSFSVKNSIFLNSGFAYRVNVANIVSIEYVELFYLWTCQDILFQNNSFWVQGNISLFSGLIYASLTQHNITLVGNFFKYSNKYAGYYYSGVILSDAPIVILKENSFHNLQCPDYSSFIHNNGAVSLKGDPTYMLLYNKKSCLVENNLFFNCSCQFGGSLGIINYDIINAKNIFIENSNSLIGGGLFLVASSSAFLNNLIFFALYSHQAHSIYIKNTIDISVSSLLILDSLSDINGGIYISKTIRSIFSNLKVYNASSLVGGVFKLKQGNFALNNSWFILCEADNGGVIYLNDNGNLTIINITFIESRSIAGGDIYVESADIIEILNMSCNGSFSENQGAALFVNIVNKFQLINSSFLNCTTPKSGVVYLKNTESIATYLLDSLICNGCSAFAGSCIFAEIRGVFNLSNFDFSRNINSSIKLFPPDNLTSFLSNGIIRDSNADYIIYSNNLQLNIENMKLLENIVDVSMVYIEEMKQFICNNITFSMNINNNDKQSIPLFISYSSFVNLSKINFTQSANPKNSMHFLFAISSKISVDSCIFLKINHSTDGFFHIESSDLWFFKIRSLKTQGIIVFGIDSNIYIDDSCFLNNTLSDNFQLSDLSISSFFRKVSVIIKNSIFLISSLLTFSITSINSLTLFNCTFIGSFSGQAFVISYSRTINISNCSFKSFINELNGGGVFSIRATQSIISIDSSIFVSNYACYSGAFLISGSFSLSVSYCVFVSNHAIFFGSIKCGVAGVALIKCEPESLFCQVILSHSLFQSNFADFSYPTVNCLASLIHDNLTFENNSDKTGFLTQLSTVPFSFHLNVSNVEIVSGNPFTFLVYLKDAFNQTIFQKSLMTASLLETTDSVQLRNTDSTPTRVGVFNFSELIITSKPNTSFQIEIRVAIYDEISLNFRIFKGTFKLFARPCQIGEIITSDNQCQLCPFGSFSFTDPMQTPLPQKCLKCPYNGFCPGGVFLVPHSGFWRYDMNSSLVISCKRVEFCLGPPILLNTEYFSNYTFHSNQEEFVHGVCKTGQTGNLCDSCISDFGKNNGLCEPCSDFTQFIIIKMVFVVLFVNVYILLTLRAVLRQNEYPTSNVLTAIGKSLINHLQKLTLIAAFDNNFLLGEFSEFMGSITLFSFANDESFSNDCLMRLFLHDYKELYIYRTYFALFLPGFITLLISSWMFLHEAWVYFANARHYYSLQRFMLVFLISSFLFYLLITKLSLSLLNCIRLDQTLDTFLYASPDIKCWTGIHEQAFFIVSFLGIICWGCFFPLILWILIRKQLKMNKFPICAKDYDNSLCISPKSNLTQIHLKYPKKEAPRLVNPYLFFYRDYSDLCYYWESILFLYKFFLSLLLNLTSQMQIEHLNVLFISLVVVYIYFLFRFSPYKHLIMTRLDFFSNIILIVFRIFSTIVQTHQILGIIISMIFMAMNFIFFAVILVFFLKKFNLKTYFNRISNVVPNNSKNGNKIKLKQDTEEKLNNYNVKKKMEFMTKTHPIKL